MKTISVEIDGKAVDEAANMTDAREVAALHVMQAVVQGKLKAGAIVAVVYRRGDRIMDKSEMMVPGASGGF